jgi:hypothetical protein
MNLKKFLQRLIAFLRTDTFFYVIVAIFTFSAIWLVFTSRYPMAFDEDYHYKIIQEYAKHWSPFFASPPAGTESLGDITRYPSYLFHYLMSFVYQFLTIFTDSDIVKIIIMRLMNVAMLASSFWIFKKLFEQMKVSRLIANLSLFIFALIPIVPFLGAHISYDNVIIPLTAFTLLSAVYVLNSLRDGTFNSNWFALFLISGLFSALTKYTYLPIFVAVFFYVLIAFGWSYRKHRFEILGAIQKNLQRLPRPKQILLIGALLVGVLLCIERYGINVMRYKTPVPECDQVLSVESCTQYGPWGRDARLRQRKYGDTPSWKIADYNKVWVRTMTNEFFFAINHEYLDKQPLVVLYEFAKFALIFGLTATTLFIVRILKNPSLRFILVTSAAYTAVLWVDNYLNFFDTHWPVAIHGRYVLPLLPAISVVLGYGIKFLVERMPKATQGFLRSFGVVCLLAGMLFGGGLLTYIVRSESSWYWQNSFVVSLNSGLHDVLIKVLK